MKEVLAGKRDLLPLSEVKHINVPFYDELSVKDLWPQMQGHADFMRFFPAQFPKGRLPDRAYMFNILNTVMPGYVTEIISHANKVRATQQHKAEQEQVITVTDDWYEKLTSIPFVSRKFLLTNICL